MVATFGVECRAGSDVSPSFKMYSVLRLPKSRFHCVSFWSGRVVHVLFDAFLMYGAAETAWQFHLESGSDWYGHTAWHAKGKNATWSFLSRGMLDSDHLSHLSHWLFTAVQLVSKRFLHKISQKTKKQQLKGFFQPKGPSPNC